MAKLVGHDMVKRGRELAHVKEAARLEWLRNLDFNRKARKAFAEKYNMNVETLSAWVRVWRKIGLGKSPAQAKTSFEAILEAIPDTSVLGGILIDGFMGKLRASEERIAELKKQMRELVEDKKKIFREYNELQAQRKTGGHYSIDQVQHQIVPKERE